MGTPYRPLPVVRASIVEAAVCEWCRWSVACNYGLGCKHPCRRSGEGPWRCHGTYSANPRGGCRLWDPSLWTRIGRRLRLWRMPVMVDKYRTVG